MTPTRRKWLQAATLWPASLALPAARKEFWESKDPATWTDDEKQVVLGESPWARQAAARMEVAKKRPSPGYGNDGRPATNMPDTRPGVPPGGAKSVPIGEAIPPPPKPDSGQPLQFPVLARWESAKPVSLAGGLDVSESIAQFYAIRLRGVPLMPPAKPARPGEPPTDPNERILAEIKAGSRLERQDKPAIPCAHLFTGAGNATDVLLFFARGADPITIADKAVTLESRFAVFHLSVKFPLKDMLYKGELAL